MEEIHKTVINLDGSSPGGDAAIKETQPTQQPQQQPQKKKGPPPEVPKKTKKIPPKAPPKPSKLIRKPSVEDEVLKELDNILEHAFDGEPIAEEDETPVAPPSGEVAQKRDSNLSSTGSSLSSSGKRLSSSNSQPSSKTNSLNRNNGGLSKTNSSSDFNKVESSNEESKRDSVFTREDSPGASPSTPEPDYGDSSGDNLSPTSEKSPSPPTVSNESSKDPGDSGISEGSTECLDKKGSVVEKTLDGKAEESIDENIPVDDENANEELPDYENFNFVKQNVLRVSRIVPV